MFCLAKQITGIVLESLEDMFYEVPIEREDNNFYQRQKPPITPEDLARHFERIKQKNQANKLAIKAKQQTMLLHFKKLATYAELRKQERQKAKEELETLQNRISALKKARQSVQNQKLKTTIATRITQKNERIIQKEAKIEESSNAGFVYILTPRQSVELF